MKVISHLKKYLKKFSKNSIKLKNVIQNTSK